MYDDDLITEEIKLRQQEKAHEEFIRKYCHLRNTGSGPFLLSIGTAAGTASRYTKASAGRETYEAESALSWSEVFSFTPDPDIQPSNLSGPTSPKDWEVDGAKRI